MMEKTKVKSREVFYCENCDDIMDECEICGSIYKIGEEVYCDGLNHFHVSCADKIAQEDAKLQHKGLGER